MPLYRTWQTRDGYESVSNGKGRAALTHELVWEALHGELPEGRVIHHDNHNHFDNRPDNLVMMSVDEHSRHHRMTGHRFNNADSALQAKRLSGVAARAADPAEREKMATVGSANIRRYMTERPEEFRAAVAGNGERGAPYLRNFNVSPRACSDCDVVAKNPSALRWHRQREHGTNHKVISATVLSERADVYCLQVEEHHNFALAAGVFVHNCGMAAQRTTLVASDLPDKSRPRSGARSSAGSPMAAPTTDATATAAPGARFRPRTSICVSRSSSPSLPSRRGIRSSREPPPGLRSTPGPSARATTSSRCAWTRSSASGSCSTRGSRGIGNAIGQYFIEAAKEEMERSFVHLPDKDLAYLSEGSALFDDYFEAVGWAQEYARTNRTLMMKSALRRARGARSEAVRSCDESRCNCHHNYVQRERHFGEDVMVTRKGAVRARRGGSASSRAAWARRVLHRARQGQSRVVRSCSHGAGRTMSRGEAKRRSRSPTTRPRPPASSAARTRT